MASAQNTRAPPAKGETPQQTSDRFDFPRAHREQHDARDIEAQGLGDRMVQ